ncbi:MAG: ABC transporter ATP-binding protein [Firmicutes bacterium]|nr:ABC transporter ATP-binding protein [Bacillota bacterium]
MSLLELSHVTVQVTDRSLRRAQRKTILEDLSFSVESGDLLMLAGPNGAGKSTIVNTIAGAVPYSGRILFEGQDVAGFSSVERARRIGILSQSHFVNYSFTVGEVVSMGRYAYSPSVFSAKAPDEQEQIEKALEMTGLTPIRDRSVLSLSGGELQRVFLAQLFVQDPQVLILDEPSNHLDISYQQQIFELIFRWLRAEDSRKPKAVMMIVHDLSLARAFGGKGLLLDQGKICGFGKPEDVFSETALNQVYGTDVAAYMRKLMEGWNL